MFDFRDRVVVVTGAAGNLGQAVARAFQAAGARLVLVDRAADRLPRLFPELAGSAEHFLATSVDLTDEEAVRAMVARALERLGRIDVSGKVVNIGARAALKGGRKAGAYSASKAAVVRLTESMAAELKKGGINVNCILPSTIDTPQNREAMPGADTSRWVKPEALADVILFLASDAARAVHGAALPVYGTG